MERPRGEKKSETRTAGLALYPSGPKVGYEKYIILVLPHACVRHQTTTGRQTNLTLVSAEGDIAC